MMGFTYQDAKKDVYFEGNEREDVMKHCEEVFIKAWQEHSRRFVIFKEGGSWEKPHGLRPNESPWFLSPTMSRRLMRMTANIGSGRRKGNSHFDPRVGGRASWYQDF
jgi:hypothetical protein